MGSELLKINSTTVVFLRISVGGVPSDYRPVPFTSVIASVWFCEQHYQELLALLKPELPPASEFKKLPSGNFTGSDFVVEWKVQAWPVGSVTVLRKSSPHDSYQNVSPPACTRLKQPTLPWLHSAQNTIAEDSEIHVQEPARYEGIHFLPYRICVSVRRKSLLPLKVEKGVIPITSFFEVLPSQPSIASPDGAFARDTESASSAVQAAQSLSSSSLGSERSNRTAALPGHESCAVDVLSVGDSSVPFAGWETQAADPRDTAALAGTNMKRNDLKSILRRPPKPMSETSCGDVSGRAAKSYEKRTGGVGLSQDQARDALRQTCAALSMTSSTTSPTRPAGRMSPTLSISSACSLSLSQGAESSPLATSPLLSPALPQPQPQKKKEDWELLYHPVVGEVEMRDESDERAGHAQLRASTSARHCWVCDAVLLVASAADGRSAADVCRACAASSRPERRVSVSEGSQSSASSASSLLVSPPPPPGPRRRNSNSTPLASPGLRRSSSCASPAWASASAFEFSPARPRLKRASSLVDSFSSGAESASSSSPPAKLSRFSSPLVEVSDVPLPDELASDDSDARFRSKICYNSRRKSLDKSSSARYSLDKFSARCSARAGSPISAISRSSSTSSVTVERGGSGEENATASRACSTSSCSTSVPAARNEPARSRAACARERGPVRSGSRTAVVSRNTKLGRVMNMEPSPGLYDSLMTSAVSGATVLLSSVSSDVLTDSSESSCSLGFKTNTAAARGTRDVGMGGGTCDDMLSVTSPEMAAMPYSPPEAASDNELLAASRSAAAAGSDSSRMRGSSSSTSSPSTSLGSPRAPLSPFPVAGPSCGSDSDTAFSINDNESDCEVVCSTPRGQKRTVRKGLRRPNRSVSSSKLPAATELSLLNNHGGRNNRTSTSELPGVVEDGSQASDESQTDEPGDVSVGSEDAEARPSYASDGSHASDGRTRSMHSQPPADDSQEQMSLTQRTRVEITTGTRTSVRKRLQRPRQSDKTVGSHRVETIANSTATTKASSQAADSEVIVCSQDKLEPTANAGGYLCSSQPSSSSATSHRVETIGNSTATRKASSHAADLEVIDCSQDELDPTANAGGYPCSSQPSSSGATEFDEQLCVLISDDSGEDDIDVAASLETVTRRQLQRYVVQFRPQLKAIFSGEQHNDRHEKYKEGGKASKQLTQQHSMVSSAQQELVAKILMAMFCRGNLKFYDYTMLVLLPECLVMLVAKLCNCSEAIAREKLIS